MKPIDGGDDVFVFLVGGGTGGEGEGGVAGNGDDVGGVIEVDFFVGEEAVDEVVLGVSGVLGVAVAAPEKGVALGGLLDTEGFYVFGAALVHVEVGGDEGGIGLVVEAEAVGDAAGVTEEVVGGPETVAVVAGGGAEEVHFLGELVVFHGVGDGLADVEVGAEVVLGPPEAEGSVIGAGVSDFPVELGDVVIDPLFLYPKFYVGKEFVVVLEGVGVAAGAVGGVLFVTIYAEGADAEADPGLCLEDGLFDFADEEIDVVASPVAALVWGEALLGGVLLKAAVVGEGLVG